MCLRCSNITSSERRHTKGSIAKVEEVSTTEPPGTSGAN